MIGNRPATALVTRTRMQNHGNHALSVVWQSLLSEARDNADVNLFERTPGYAKKYSVSFFQKQDDMFAAFDRIAQGFVDAARAASRAAEPVACITHDVSVRQVVRFRRLRRWLRLRSISARLGQGRGDFLARLKAILACDTLVVNPAGEFDSNANETAISYLYDLRCAQLAGLRTACVNLTFEPRDKTVIALSRHVFDHCDLVLFRDQQSIDTYLAAGGTGNAVVVADGALLTPRPNGAGDIAAQRPLRLAMSLNLMRFDDGGVASDVRRLLTMLKSRGDALFFTSNEWTSDLPFIARFNLEGLMVPDTQTYGFQEFMSSLTRFDAVVSNRLHTCVLAMAMRVPVVPIELDSVKIDGLYTQIGLPGETIAVDEGWIDRVLDRIEAIRTSQSTFLDRQSTCFEAARDTLRNTILEQLRRHVFV